MVTACGEAVHVDRERAVRKALLEYASSRARKAFCQASLESLEAVAPEAYRSRVAAEAPAVEEDRALEAMLGWLGRGAADLQAMLARSFHAERRRVPLSALPTGPAPEDPAGLLDLVGGRLRAAGLDVLWVSLGDAVGHAIVPGLEVETATYHRCGERNLRRLESRGLAGRGPAPEGCRALGGRARRPGWRRTASTSWSAICIRSTASRTATSPGRCWPADDRPALRLQHQRRPQPPARATRSS